MAANTPSPFDIIGMMFKTNGEFESLSDNLLERNFFIINRSFSIKYPLQGSIFNKMGINTAAVIKAWRNFLITKEGVGRVPYFVYSKGAKKSKETEVKKTDNIKEDTILEYCKRYHITLKDYNNLKLLYNNELINDVKRYEKLIDKKEQEKTISK